MRLGLCLAPVSQRQMSPTQCWTRCAMVSLSLLGGLCWLRQAGPGCSLVQEFAGVAGGEGRDGSTLPFFWTLVSDALQATSHGALA